MLLLLLTPPQLLLLHLQVGGELSKYGKVEDVLIFEVITPGYPPEEAVRIFVKFDRVEPATRALVDLQGRFFGGKQVRDSSPASLGFRVQAVDRFQLKGSLRQAGGVDLVQGLGCKQVRVFGASR